MSFFTRQNFVSKSVKPLPNPMEAVPEKPFPKAWTKKKLITWLGDPETNHQLLSLCEGLNPHEIISRENPLETVHGITVEWDFDPSQGKGLELNLEDGCEPTYFCRSFSGGVRFYYVFERPIKLVAGVYPAFVKKAGDLLGFFHVFGKPDEKTLINPGQYYEIGRSWVHTGNLINHALVLEWAEHASRRYPWDTEGLVIPIEDVRNFLADKYPGKWPGGWDEFDLGKRGVRFWDETADASSAVVCSTGVYSHTGGRNFTPWSHPNLCGKWAVKWATKKIGEVVKDVYFDGKKYWMKTCEGWRPHGKDDTGDILLQWGLSRKPSKNEELDDNTRALNMAKLQNSIEAAVPKLYHPDGAFRDDKGERWLNISTVKPLAPRPDKSKGWGDGFPWLARYLEGVFLDDDLQRVLGWIRHAYLGAVNQNFERGLGLIIAGPTSIGKNFFNKGLVGGLLGGCEDAAHYLVDGEKYNSNLLKSPLWMLNDVKVKNRTEYSNILKRAIANDAMNYRAMYVNPATWEWVGRIIITCNDDEQGVTVLPRTDVSILDKLLILRGHVPSTFGDKYPSDKELKEGELPHFAAYLRDTKTPAEFVGSSRFGVAHYADPDLLAEAQSATPQSGVIELLDLWRAGRLGGGATWTGNATALYAELDGEGTGTRGVLRSVARSPNSLGRFLSNIIKDKVVDWIRAVPGPSGGRSRDYEIDTSPPKAG